MQGEKDGVDYLGAGPFYHTASKDVSISPILGPAGLKKIKETVSIPVVGIGGIGLSNIEEVKGQVSMVWL